MTIHGIEVKGVGVNPQTRCAHYATPQDIIAIKFFCCQTYYPCHACHHEVADHHAIVWPSDQFNEKAILCGVCGWEMSITEYMNSHYICPNCEAEFNPRCQNHYGLYFQVPHDRKLGSIYL